MSSPAGPPAPPAPAPNAPAAAAAPQPSIAELFLAFAAISLSGFGGVLAWARRIMVERQRPRTIRQCSAAARPPEPPRWVPMGWGDWPGNSSKSFTHDPEKWVAGFG